MSLPLTPSRLRAVYDALRVFPPFSRWRMPEGVKFRVSRAPMDRGDYEFKDGKHVICVSSACIGRFDSLGAVLAHEMIHLRQKCAKTETPNAQHNAEFKRFARTISKRFGWDEKLF